MLDRIFSFRVPAITMGIGARRMLPQMVKSLGRRVCLVADPGVRLQMRFDEIVSSLCDADCEVTLFCDVPSDPPIACAFECSQSAAGADVILGIGGGSVLDVSKVTAILVKHGPALSAMFGIDQVPGRGIPTILVPTTAGTGSEVTPIAVLSDSEQQLKRGIVSDHLLADHAVIDPEMCLTLPARPTAYTGMDTLTHAIEAFTNKFAVPLIDSFALEAVRLVGSSLRQAVEEPENVEARYNMSLASLLGGFCLRSVNTAAVHALAYPLGGRFNVPHGIANSLLLPYVMRFNAPVVAHKYAAVAAALGEQDAVTAVEKLSAAVGTNTRMREFEVGLEDLPDLARAAMEVERLLKNNPREMTETDAREIYHEAW